MRRPLINCPTRTSSHVALYCLSLFVALVLMFAPATTALAESTVTVDANEATYSFSQQIVFTLRATATAPVTELVLFYGQQDEHLVRRIYPTFETGTTLDVSYTEVLAPGQYAPGTTMRYYWQLTLQDGSIFVTEPQTFEYTDTNHDWQTIPGERVDLLWYGNSSKLAKDLATKANTDVQTLEDRYGYQIKTHLRVYVYNSTTDMSAALASRSQGYDAAVTTLGVAVSESTLLLLGSHRDVSFTISHELSHLVVGQETDNPFTGLPRWLDEGLAMYAEGELRSQNQTALDRGIRTNTLLTIRSMTSYSGQASQVDLFYGQAYSIVDYLIRSEGVDKLRELLKVMAQGIRQEEALQQVYGFGLDELDSRWRDSVGAEPLPTAVPTVNGKSNTSQVTGETRTPTTSPVKTVGGPCTLGAGALVVPLLGGVFSLRRRGPHEVL